MKKLLAAATSLLVVATLATAVAADQYDLSVTKPSSAKVNARAVATVSISPKGAYHVNTEYPTKLKLSAPTGVTLEKQVMVGTDAKKLEKAGLVYEVGFTAGESGKKTISGELRFAVCTDTDCKPTVEKVSIDVDVQ